MSAIAVVVLEVISPVALSITDLAVSVSPVKLISLVPPVVCTVKLSLAVLAEKPLTSSNVKSPLVVVRLMLRLVAPAALSVVI